MQRIERGYEAQVTLQPAKKRACAGTQVEDLVFDFQLDSDQPLRTIGNAKRGKGARV